MPSKKIFWYKRTILLLNCACRSSGVCVGGWGGGGGGGVRGKFLNFNYFIKIFFGGGGGVENLEYEDFVDTFWGAS